MGEITGIEIDPESPRIAPIDPALKMGNRVGVAVHAPGGEVGIAGMDNQMAPAPDQPCLALGIPWVTILTLKTDLPYR